MWLARVLALWIVVCSYGRAAIAGVETSYRALVQAPQVDVAPIVAGRIKRIYVHDGQQVKERDVLVTLDDREPRARVVAATTELAVKQAQLARAEAALKTTPADRLDVAQATVALAAARVAQAQAALELAQFDVEATAIPAGISGTIALRAIAPDQAVEREQSLGTIVDLDGAWVDAFFAEAQIAHVAIGQDADVVVLAAPDRKIALHGTVADVDRNGAALVHTLVDGGTPAARVGIRVKIKLDGERRDRMVQPGMAANVTVHTR